MPDNCSPISAWKKINIFTVMDGHGGQKCVEYAMENLNNYII